MRILKNISRIFMTITILALACSCGKEKIKEEEDIYKDFKSTYTFELQEANINTDSYEDFNKVLNFTVRSFEEALIESGMTKMPDHSVYIIMGNPSENKVRINKACEQAHETCQAISDIWGGSMFPTLTWKRSEIYGGDEIVYRKELKGSRSE